MSSPDAISDQNANVSKNTDSKIGALRKSDITKPAREISREEWSRILTPFQFSILRAGHTERAGSGQYVKNKEKGSYHCGACGALLFDSDAKFESKCGWPSFSRPARAENLKESNVGRRMDSSYGLVRVEVFCQTCNSHVGHVFDDGPRPTGERFCVNSAALEFVPEVKK